ncbi:MAG: FtsX-like permease family protein [Alphaproteobacteria bacterium]|nr:FtsX-like permease family protein [Alphaproteobacteria bacterium]
MKPLEVVRSALRALAGNPLRSLLTMLGIFIGVAAVIVMVAVGSGGREQVMRQINSLGTNLLIVVPSSITAFGARLGAGARQTLGEDDAQAIQRELAQVQAASGTSRFAVQVIAGNSNWSTNLQGIAPGYFEIREWGTAWGREFTPEEFEAAHKVALLGETVWRNLYGEADPVGETIRVRNVPFVIVGVLARKGQSTAGFDQDDIVLTPLSTAKRRVFGVNPVNPRYVQAILVKVRDGEDMAEVEQQVRDLLRQRHRLQPNQEDDFQVRNMTELMSTRDESSRTLAILLASVAAVSLLVGGVGIMNIMLVSVTERTHEIGLRMAVGARPADILAQFLIEATTLALLGGAAGVGLGIGASRLLAEAAGWPTLIQPEAVVVALLFSGAVGVFFGFYPARRAARLDPIEALRHD